MSVNTIAIVVGRLLEIRAEAGYRSRLDVEVVTRAIQGEMKRLPQGASVVIVADWQLCPVMHEEAAQHLVEQLRSNNPRVERSAALASQKSPIAVLQFVRLVREANNPKRRLFYEPKPLIEWLTPVLTPQEATRLREFLVAGSASPG
ncbi:MAG: hypothetical protein ABI895_25395 [Deltaproteobacteria bacterium]